MRTPSFLSIQIVHFGHAELLRQCLGSIHTATRFVNELSVPAGVEIRVYDDGSSPQFVDEIEQVVRRERAFWGDRLSLHRSAVRKGAHIAHNEMLGAEPLPKFALLVDSSFRVRPDFFVATQTLEDLSPTENHMYAAKVTRDGRDELGARLNAFQARIEGLQTSSRQKRNAVRLAPLVVPVEPFLSAGGFSPKVREESAAVELSWRLVHQRGWKIELLESLSFETETQLEGQAAKEIEARLQIVPQLLNSAYTRKLAVSALRAEALGRGVVAWVRDRNNEAEALFKLARRRRRFRD